jgi:hypothetical protein
MRRLLLAAVAALAVAVSTRADDRPEPVVTARVRSVLDLTGYFEYLGGCFGQADPAKQAAQLVRGLADPDKGIEGFDPARPIGAYGVLVPDVVNSYAVVVLPVADETAVLQLLTGRLNLDPKKKNDIYELKVPNVPVPVFFRFANKSAYVTARSADPLADDLLTPPDALFAGQEEAVATVRLYPGRVPEPLRRLALGQLELQLKQQAKAKPAGADANAEYWQRVGQDGAFAVLKSLVLEVTELTARVGIDPKADDLSAEIVLTPKVGSPLAKLVAGETGLTGVAGRLARPDATATAGVRIDLPKSVQKDLDAGVDKFIAGVVDRETGKDKKMAKLVMGAIAPTLKSGVIDFGLVVLGDAPGKVRAVAEVRVKGGAGIARVLKEGEAEDPSKNAKSEFDVATEGGVALHKVTFVNGGDLAKATGSPAVWLGTADDRLMVSFGPDEGLLKKLILAERKPVPVARLDVSAGRVFKLVNKDLPAETMDKLVAEHVGTGTDGKDAVRLAVTGGEALTVRLTAKGKAVRLATALDQANKEK